VDQAIHDIKGKAVRLDEDNALYFRRCLNGDTGRDKDGNNSVHP
jgi:hypothetical protein